jgi:hypothetical protein
MEKTPPFRSKNNAPAAAGRKAGSDYAAVRLALVEQKDRAVANRLEIQNAVTRGDLIPRELLKAVLGRIDGSFTGIIFQIGETWSGYMFNIIFPHAGNGPEADSNIRNICTNREYEAARAVKESLDKWLRSRGTDDAE